MLERKGEASGLRLAERRIVLFIVFYGLAWVATVLPTITITTETLGLRDGPIFYDWIFTAHQLGGATVATAAGVIRTATGGTSWPFWRAGCSASVRPASACTCTGRAHPRRSPRSPSMADWFVSPDGHEGFATGSNRLSTPATDS
jgi:hypothetical protein